MSEQTQSIVFLGDSLTAGYGLHPTQAYPALFEEELRRQGLPYRVVNAGISGDTTAGGLRRLPVLLRRKPEYLVIALGANDMLRSVPPGEVQANLERMILSCKEAAVRPLLFGMKAPPVWTAYQQEFDAIYPRLSEKHQVPLLPFFLEEVALQPRYCLSDGLHPNAEGQLRMALAVERFLLPVLRREGGSTLPLEGMGIEERLSPPRRGFQTSSI